MNRLKRILVGSILFSLFLGLPVHPRSFARDDGTAVYDLMTDDLTDPVGIDNPSPVFRWKLRSSVPGQKQTAYQVIVKKGDAILWDSGKVESDSSVGIVYGGDSLCSSTVYTWSVTVWDKDGKPLTSPEASFETALLEADAFAEIGRAHV